MIITHIRDNIKRLRRNKGITQREMSLRLYMDERTYAKMERGTNKSMDVRLLSSIAEILETDITELLRQPTDENDAQAGRKSKPVAHTALEGQDLMLQEVRLLKEEVRELIDFQKKALHLLSLASATL